MNYRDCLSQLKNNTVFTQEWNLSVRVKPIPDDPRDGVPDPRAALAATGGKPYPAPADPARPSLAEIRAIRGWMGCETRDLSHGVSARRLRMETDAGLVTARLYTPAGDAPRPAVLYFHGGAFYGGTVRVVENACKLLAERSGALVAAVEYALAPEHPYPEGLTQCWQAVNWLHAHARELGADPARLAVMGDSAGGNLAVGCSLMDKQNLIKLQILLYPAVMLDMRREQWSQETYAMRPEYRTLLTGMVRSLREGMPTLAAAYVQKPDQLAGPLVSPLLADGLAGLPTTMIVTAEYDYLRVQGEQFAQRLSEDNVDTVLYRYKGMGHSFFEHTGEFPQAEDCTDEAAEAIRSL